MAHGIRQLLMDLLTGLLAFWKLDDSLDSSGNGLTLTAVGSPEFVSGKIGDCAGFGVGEGLTVSPFNIGATFTVSVWAKFSTLENDELVWVQYIGAGVYVNTDGAAAFGDLASWTASSPSGAALPNVWQHYCLVSESGRGTLYVDGGEVASESISLINLTNAGDRPFGLGGDGESSGSAVNKQIDACGVWGRALSVEEVALLFNGGAGVEYPFGTETDILLSGFPGSTTIIGAGLLAV